jgi:sporulation protein YlmC with PRC-barrel domain
MAVLSLADFCGKQTVTIDAYSMGEILDLRYNPRNWTVAGVVLKGSKGVYSLLPPTMAKSPVMLKPGKAVIRDVYMIPDKRENVMRDLVADNPMMPSLSSLIRMKVELTGGTILGNVTAVEIDPSNWEVRSLKVKMDKAAMKEMGLKGLLPKTASGILTMMISTVSDRVILKKTLVEIQRSLVVD